MLEFNLPDMSCGHCVGVVTKTVKQADPQASVEIDLAAHRLRVESSAERATLAAALADAGYPPS